MDPHLHIACFDLAKQRPECGLVALGGQADLQLVPVLRDRLTLQSGRSTVVGRVRPAHPSQPPHLLSRSLMDADQNPRLRPLRPLRQRVHSLSQQLPAPQIEVPDRRIQPIRRVQRPQQLGLGTELDVVEDQRHGEAWSARSV